MLINLIFIALWLFFYTVFHTALHTCLTCSRAVWNKLPLTSLSVAVVSEGSKNETYYKNRRVD